MTKRKREQRHDKGGPLTKMAEADGWVMVRRPHCIPFAITVKEWDALSPDAMIEEEQGYVYFIEGGTAIKIGFSRSMETRLRKMGTDVPGGAKLLHIEPGTFKTEKILHRHFAAHRLHGEWFSKAPELLAYIEQRKAMWPHGFRHHDRSQADAAPQQ